MLLGRCSWRRPQQQRSVADIDFPSNPQIGGEINLTCQLKRSSIRMASCDCWVRANCFTLTGCAGAPHPGAAHLFLALLAGDESRELRARLGVDLPKS